ncbi:MAG TPA: glycogen/starch/alpha-glucan phosphorylase [Verrucomicrobiae bacterium]
MKRGLPLQKASEFLSTETARTGLRVEDIKQAFLGNLFYAMGRVPAAATLHDAYTALALTVRDRLFRRSVETAETAAEKGGRVVCYFSAEYLPGPHLANNLLSLGATEVTRQAMTELGLDLDVLIEQEEEPGLGNGGLGRLASCYMDSLASVQVPAIGYGIRYEFGIFDQQIRDGCQVEITDKWLRNGNPWEINRPELAYDVQFGGRTDTWKDEQGRFRVRWIPDEIVKGIAYDTPILGYSVPTCNTLRLWKAEAVESFDFAAFNQGDYYRAVDAKVQSENITKVLYPNDEPAQGKRLRLQQQYFFVTCSLQDMFRLHQLLGGKPQTFHERFAIQLNDTHPAITVPELMRLLIDEYLVDWDAAWNVTTKTIAYTNHTLLPEALEKWSVELLGSLLPRHLEIIYEINQRFLAHVRNRFPADEAKISRISIIDENGGRYVRMANLATVGSHHVNGVAALHSELLKRTVLHDFAELSPEKFCNVTNGVTPRRFVALSNPELATLITDKIGDGWLSDLTRLRRLEPLADDSKFQEQWRQIKLNSKRKLAALIAERTGIKVDPASLFDIQVKRFHEYKRQHLNVLHIVHRYQFLKRNPSSQFAPRTFIFGGKAAPGYYTARMIIRLIVGVANTINNDAAVNDRMKVVFFPDFNVKNANHVYPAADLSEQISTAGKEASGTGNMKFSLNGALTIGTLDGANIEIREETGHQNFFLFGLTTEQVAERKARGYNPYQLYVENPALRDVLDLIAGGEFSGGDKTCFLPLVDSLLNNDPYMLLADFPAYVECQAKVDALWKQPVAWTRQSILITSRMGKFSSDRSIREYCEQIWKVRSPSK